MDRKQDLLSMILQVCALASASADAAESAEPNNPDGIEKLINLVYLMEDLAQDMKSAALRQLDFPDSRLAAAERENEQLRNSFCD